MPLTSYVIPLAGELREEIERLIGPNLRIAEDSIRVLVESVSRDEVVVEAATAAPGELR